MSTLPTDIIDYGSKAIKARKELAELEQHLKDARAKLGGEAEGSNKEARDGWATAALAAYMPTIHGDIRDKRAYAESQEIVVEAIKAQIRIDLIVALGGNLTDDQAIHRHIERMEEDPRVTSILDDDDVLGNEQEGLR